MRIHRLDITAFGPFAGALTSIESRLSTAGPLPYRKDTSSNRTLSSGPANGTASARSRTSGTIWRRCRSRSTEAQFRCSSMY